MTREEIEQRQEEFLKGLDGQYSICIGSKSKEDKVLGCFFNEKTKMWNAYYNYNRECTITCLETEDEEAAFNKLYSMIEDRIREIRFQKNYNM